MTRPPESMVREFHETFGFHVAVVPTQAPWHVRKERARLIAEEAAEAISELLATGNEALWADQLAAERALVDIFTDRCQAPQRRPMLDRIARELGDLTYVTAGGAVNNGVPLTAVVAEIHAANMRKLGPDGKPIVDEHGKARKPKEGWQPPDIAAVLAGTATQPGIRPVTCYEVWCLGNGLHAEHPVDLDGRLGNDVDEAAELAVDADVMALPDLRVYCYNHVPPELCWAARPPYGDGEHAVADDPSECVNCGASLPAATPQAVTA